MSLFDQVLGAIQNPQQMGSLEQLSGIISGVQEVSNTHGVSPEIVQTVLSTVGSSMRSSLQQTNAESGPEAAQDLLNQVKDVASNPLALQLLLPQDKITELSQTIAAKTGLNEGQTESMISSLIPLVAKVLQTGASAENPQAAMNNVLNTFLDADGDSDVDISDALAMAQRFLQQ